MLDSLAQPNVQRALAEVAALAVLAGTIGTWIVLRGLAFYAHAVGTATFPGLVLAAGLGVAAGLGAAVAATAAALVVARVARREDGAGGTATALMLVGALALGVVLASDVFASPASVETALFGSLLLVSWGDVGLAAAIAVVALAADRWLGDRWMAAGLDPAAAAAAGLRPARTDAVLLALVAAAAVATLAAVGALLAAAILVVPAATARLLTTRHRSWRVATAGLTTAIGVVGVLGANLLDLPAGPAVATLAAATFLLVAVGRALAASGRLPGARASRGLAVGAAALVLAGCGASGEDGASGGPAGGEGPSVVASTTQLGDIATAVAGPDAQVTTLLQPGSDPHDYEPRPSDVRSLAGADVVLQSGLGLDAFVEEAAEQSGTDARLVDVGADLPHQVRTAEGGHADHGGEAASEEGHDHGGEKASEGGHDHDHGGEAASEEGHDHGGEKASGGEHDHGAEAASDAGHADHGGETASEGGHGHGGEAASEEGHDHGGEPASEEGHDHGGETATRTAGEAHDHGPDDPHWWHDPRNGAAAADAVAEALAAQNPAGAAGYRQRAADYGRQLEQVDGAIAACMARIPDDRRRMVTNHEAFGHFADRYDVEVVGAVIPSTTTQAQASVGDLAELRRTVADEDVPAIFPETAASPDVARRLAELTGARVGRELQGDALGPKGSPTGTYPGMLLTNAAHVAEGLTGRPRGGCELPAPTT